MRNLKEKRKQLLNLTITEIILIMLFLALLISYWVINENKKLQANLENYKDLKLNPAQLAEFKKFQDAIEELKKENGEFSKMQLNDIIKELVLARDNYKKLKDKDTEIAQLKEKLKDYEKDKKELEYYKKKIWIWHTTLLEQSTRCYFI